MIQLILFLYNSYLDIPRVTLHIADVKVMWTMIVFYVLNASEDYMKNNNIIWKYFFTDNIYTYKEIIKKQTYIETAEDDVILRMLCV